MNSSTNKNNSLKKWGITAIVILIAVIVAIITALLLPTKTKSQSTAKVSKDPTETVHYSAAASLQGTLDNIYKNFHKAHPTIKVEFDYAGSGQIRQKVVSGAPIDGVLFASKSDMDILKAKKMVSNSQLLLGNKLVLITNKKSDLSSKTNLSDLLKNSKKIAIGQPATVPAGKYATDAIEKLGLTATLKDNLVNASDVRQVLAYVASGNADVGFVYQTDVAVSNEVKVLKVVPEKLHDPVVYYTGTIKDEKAADGAKIFNSYLTTNTAAKQFKAAGFTIKTK